MDRLNPMDAQFVDAEDEDRNASFAIASIAVFDGPAPSYQEFYTAVEGRLPLVPIYRRKLRTVPFRLGPPVWVDDPHFDLHYHIRQTALPAPGGDEQLADLIALVMTQRLDRHFPLWEDWLVEGLSEDRWALISKVHHCMVDGIAGTDLYRVIFDLSPEPGPPVAQAPPVAAEPNGLALAALVAVDTVVPPAPLRSWPRLRRLRPVRRSADPSADSAGTPGHAARSARSRRSSASSAGPSTTSCSRRSAAASGPCCSPAESILSPT
jgi:diacylglycerol O-acyltransferase / wax synthase